MNNHVIEWQSVCLVGVCEKLLTGCCLHLSNQLVYCASLQMGFVGVYNCLTFFVLLCTRVTDGVCSFTLLMLKGFVLLGSSFKEWPCLWPILTCIIQGQPGQSQWPRFYALYLLTTAKLLLIKSVVYWQSY